MLTHATLLRDLHYDPNSGRFTWTAQALTVSGRRHPRAGQSAGWTEPTGYIRIGLRGRAYLAHRLAWFYVHGVWPGELDHRNGDRGDYRLENLREVTHSENAQNIHAAHSDSASGVLGVRARHGRWTAAICTDGKRRHLGTFDTAEEAAQAYENAKREQHPAWAEA